MRPENSRSDDKRLIFTKRGSVALDFGIYAAAGPSDLDNCAAAFWLVLRREERITAIGEDQRGARAFQQGFGDEEA